MDKLSDQTMFSIIVEMGLLDEYKKSGLEMRDFYYQVSTMGKYEGKE